MLKLSNVHWFHLAAAATAAALLVVIVPRQSLAKGGYFEVSLGGSYSRSNYSDTDYEWTRRLSASIGYHFNDISEIEISYQDTMSRTHILNYADTTSFDKVYSANWVQAFSGRNFPLQPYLKVGVGQLNREVQSSYSSSPVTGVKMDSVTGVAGAGLRVFLGKNFAIRSEVTSYLAGGSIRNWNKDLGVTVGLSAYF